MPERRIEHIALTDKLFRTCRVENDARFHRGGDGKCDAGGDVGLHQTGNNVRRRTLRGDDKMDARGTAHLRDAADRLLNLLGCNQHEVCQLVDYDNDLRHRLKFIVRRGARLFVVGFEIADACVCHHAVSPHHLRHSPLETASGLFRVGDDGNQQMRNAVINAEFNHLRVDHDQLDLFWLRFIEKGNNQRVHAD